MTKKQEAQAESHNRGETKPVHMDDQKNIKDLLFLQHERPKHLHDVKIVNVFEDRYRINVWVRVEEGGFEKTKIHSSYFARYDGENLHIRA